MPTGTPPALKASSVSARFDGADRQRGASQPQEHGARDGKGEADEAIVQRDRGDSHGRTPRLRASTTGGTALRG